MTDYFTVKDLHEAIKDLPDDARVVLQSDAEGNGYRYALGAEFDGVVVQDHNWRPDIYNSSWTAEEAGMDEDEWGEFLAKPRVLVIYPVN